MKLTTMRDVKLSDAESIADIYNHYIRKTIITFEENEITKKDIESRILTVESSGLPWIVVENNNKIQGYAYAGNWSERSAYRHTVESTVYLSPFEKSKGLGTQLYRELLSRLKEKSIHSVIGGISLPNPASIALHEKFGMEKVAHFKEVGFKFNQWVDVGYWQIKL